MSLSSFFYQDGGVDSFAGPGIEYFITSDNQKIQSVIINLVKQLDHPEIFLKDLEKKTFFIDSIDKHYFLFGLWYTRRSMIEIDNKAVINNFSIKHIITIYILISFLRANRFLLKKNKIIEEILSLSCYDLQPFEVPDSFYNRLYINGTNYLINSPNINIKQKLLNLYNKFELKTTFDDLILFLHENTNKIYFLNTWFVKDSLNDEWIFDDNGFNINYSSNLDFCYLSEFIKLILENIQEMNIYTPDYTWSRDYLNPY